MIKLYCGCEKENQDCEEETCFFPRGFFSTGGGGGGR